MAKRLTPFIGLAVVAALALAAAFGAFSLNPAFAGVDAPDARGLAPAVDFQSQAVTTWPPDPVFTEETDAGTATARGDFEQGTAAPANMRMYKGETFTVDLANVISNTDGLASALQLDHWQMTVPATETPVVRLVAAAPNPSTDNPPTDINTRALAATSSSTEVTITAVGPGRVLARIEAADYSTTPSASPVSGEVSFSFYTFTIDVAEATLTPSSTDPGARTRYRVVFTASSDMSTGEEISIELEDFRFPSSANADSVTIESDAYYVTEDDNRATDAQIRATDAKYRGGVLTPTSAYVSGEKLKLTVPDMNPETDRSEGIRKGDRITVVIQQGAGIANPTEGSQGGVAKITNTVDDSEQETAKFTVGRLVELNEDSGGRGTVVTATGKGFKNGTTLGFFLDEGGPDGTGDPDGIYTSGVDTILCEVARVSGDDTGSCDFTVNNPPFDSGNNYVNAIDGRSNRATDPTTGDNVFELEPSITVSPASGNPGDDLQIQLVDFVGGSSITRVELARDQRPVATALGSVSTNGDANIRVTIPDWASAGIQDLRVTVTKPSVGDNACTVTATEDCEQSDNVNVTIGGPDVTASPETVLPNQRISLRGSGFAAGALICCTDPDGTATAHSAPSIAIGGAAIDTTLINEDGGTVTVDSGGNWATSVDLPINTITTTEGTREIRVTDSKGRTGTVEVTIPARTVTIDPPSGRVGTTATVRGEGFPSKNDEGSSFNVEITYTASGSETKVSALPDASGRFEAEIRIPTSANIPSTNTVEVEFSYGPSGSRTTVVTTVSHKVPKGLITLSQTRGAPGATVTVTGSGFNAYASVTEVTIGSLDITPIPQARTDSQGRVEFDVIIPGMNSGIQTLDVTIRDIVSSAGFTVTSAADIGAETPVAEAVANMGDNFVRSFNFNNDTKEWTFYDPMAGDASSQNVFIAGASYWVLVGATQEVILNGRTRTLTCVAGNCWNQIVW